MREGESEGALDWDRRGLCDVWEEEEGLQGIEKEESWTGEEGRKGQDAEAEEGEREKGEEAKQDTEAGVFML